jgi:hypothetical protein
MITYNFEEAKEKVIDLIKRNTYDFYTDVMSEIKNAATHDSIDDVEMFVCMIRNAEEMCQKQIDIVKKAISVTDILSIASKDDEMANLLYEQEDLILSEILGVKIKQDWGC